MTFLREKALSAKERHLPGEAGVWVFLFGDMVVFGLLFGVYLHSRAGAPELFARSQTLLDRDLGVLNTCLLLTSSLLVASVVRAARAGSSRTARVLLVAGWLCGAGFVVVKAFEYHAKLSVGITPNTDGFFLLYYVLTGVHLFHVLVGLAMLAALSFAVDHPVRRRILLEGGSCFWHMVDLLWIVIFPLVYLVR